MSDDQRVRVEAADGVCRLVLANPAAHNVVDHAFGEQFLAALVGPAREARCVEIVAEGQNFCVGGDVRGFAAAPDRSLSELADHFHTCERALLDLAAPVVIGVNGWAAGIGLSLVLVGDVIVLGESARLRPAYTAIGLSPDGGMTATLPAAVGRARAMDMFLTNRPMGAAEALAAGLAVPRRPGRRPARRATDGVADAIAAGPAEALAATKRLVREAAGHAVRRPFRRGGGEHRRARRSPRRAARASPRSWASARRCGPVADNHAWPARSGHPAGWTSQYTAEATSSGDARNGHVRSSDGIIDQDMAMPKEMGGPGGATNPEQLFAAGYAACFHQALKLAAGQEKVDVDSSTVDAQVGIGPDATSFGLQVRLTVHLPGADQETADRLAARAHELCPYSKATKRQHRRRGLRHGVTRWTGVGVRRSPACASP